MIAGKLAEYVKNYGDNLPPRILQDEEMLNMVVSNFITDMKVNTSFWFDKLTQEEQQPFDVPCVGFWGKKDKIVGIESMSDWKTVFPKMELIQFDDMAHMLVAPTEKQQEIMEELKKWILR